ILLNCSSNLFYVSIFVISALSFVISAEGLIEVFGYEGRGVNVSCHYDQGYENSKKYFLITSSNTQNGRFRLSDDRKSRIFTVTISSLTLKDSGSYLCGVQRNSGFDVFSAVELKSYNISGIEGRPVTLQCPNSGQQHDNKKFLCKGDQHNNCTDMMENQTKFKLLNVSSTCFSVIITELEAADAGTYYCGSDSQLRFTKIQLAVGETNTERDRIIKSNTKFSLRQYLLHISFDNRSINKTSF
uniref:Immunoglobulin domain-containing protein n=1 Tax=Xiphophorus maculatus TaxID=8083 RepID=A0A3B5QEC7_XIPMA